MSDAPVNVKIRSFTAPITASITSSTSDASEGTEAVICLHTSNADFNLSIYKALRTRQRLLR